MTARPRQQGLCLNIFRRESPATPLKKRAAIPAMALMLILPAWTSLAAAGPIGTPTPPPAPQVTPIISASYPTDLDGNRISDDLENNAAREGDLSIASTDMVEVELIFSEPVTQQQIDDFLRLDGQITYMYQAVSFGWNGCLSRQAIDSLPSVMGPALVQVEAAQQIQYCMDTATQTGRVRPVWKAGFAGVANGLRGSPDTTIGFLGGGVDATHADLKGRNVYWTDFTVDAEPTPVDYDGHDTLVAGIAVGTGTAGGSGDEELRFTYTYADSSYPTWGHVTDPISLPARSITMKSSAWWTGQTSILDQYRWTRGTDGTDSTREVGSFLRSQSPAVLTNTFTGSPSDIFATVLLDYDTRRPVENVTIVTSVTPYPGPGDGLNKFSGVAPGCKWAAVKVFDRDGYASSSDMARGLDDFVLKCVDKNIKIVNISIGYMALGIPAQSTSLRDKVNTMVNNGIVVVAAAGNGANDDFELYRTMSDPARAAMAITVGASNDENAVTEYSTYGFIMPRANVGEDFKPDLIAPGGSYSYTGLLSAESGSSDGLGMDKEPDDYASGVGTSFSAPFVSGCAALIIDAMKSKGIAWKFGSADHPRYIKMLLCATASETNTTRESKQFNPTLSRAAAGPEGFPAGKDQHEGYGIINADAAVEAVCQTYAVGSTVTADLGGNASAKRVWARTVELKTGVDIDLSLAVPDGADFDLYLYSSVPSNTGAPVILRSSTAANAGDDETLQYTPTASAKALLVVKRVSGAGTFTLKSIQAGPPVASDLQANGGINSAVTITLVATDDGRPNPPGALSYSIASLPKHGRLESVSGTAIAAVPTKLTNPADKVVYRPDQDWVGDDSFTFYAHDGGNAPLGGQSNTATVKVTIVSEITVEYQVTDGMDDAYCVKWGMQQSTDESILLVGQYAAGMRFRGVKIPQGAAIKSATLKIRSCSTGLTGQLDGILYAEAANNAEDFSARKISQLTKTDASVLWAWGADAPWTASTWYESPNIAGVVQEVVDRSGWKSDNAMVIVYWTTTYSGSDRKIWAYDGNAAHAAKLVITYQPK
ncbi:MAG: S8 family serine peptidase [Phycisphaerales bacterium]